MEYGTWSRGVNALGGECVAMNPGLHEEMDSSGSILVSDAIGPVGLISRAFQVQEDADTVDLALVYTFSAPVRLDNVTLTPSTGGTPVSFQNLLTRSGYVYFRRDEPSQFVGGSYQVTFSGLAATACQGTVQVGALPSSGLPATDLDAVNESGTTGQPLSF